MIRFRRIYDVASGTFTINSKGILEIGKKLGSLKIPTLVVQEGGYSLINLKSGSKNFLLGLSISLL